MKNFLRYFCHYVVNWMWTLGSLLFIGLFLHAGAPIFTVLALIPAIMLVYGFVSEYYAYMDWGKGKQLAYIFYGAAFAVLVFVIVMCFFKQL